MFDKTDKKSSGNPGTVAGNTITYLQWTLKQSRSSFLPWYIHLIMEISQINHSSWECKFLKKVCLCICQPLLWWRLHPCHIFVQKMWFKNRDLATGVFKSLIYELFHLPSEDWFLFGIPAEAIANGTFIIHLAHLALFSIDLLQRTAVEYCHWILYILI